MFPFLILGFMMITNVSAARYVAPDAGAGIQLLGPSFGIGMGIAIAAYLTLFYLALKHRHNLKLHAGYVLVTPLILFESPFSRIIGDYLPWTNVIGSEGPRQVLDTIFISDGLAIVFALALWTRNRKHGAPWLVAAGFMGLQAAAMWFAPDVPMIGSAFAGYAAAPPGVTLALGVVAGAAPRGLAGVRARCPQSAPAPPPEREAQNGQVISQAKVIGCKTAPRTFARMGDRKT